jgi:transcription elongation GreA/GreB family factor
MNREQADRLARLMADARPTRPAGVLTASLEYRAGRARLVAIWRDEETLARYLAEAPVPRGTELMRKVGVEPTVTRFEILELG